jgi:predicted Fe-Mo cluster-binding NifX family protein
MRKAAFAYWDNRIAPVFDSANQVYLVEVDSNRITAETLEVLPDDQLVQKALRLAELAVETLVCGAISRSLHEIVCAYGIQVVPFVAGELREVIQAWRSNNLYTDAFAMPGCRRRGHSLRKCAAGRRRNIT